MNNNNEYKYLIDVIHEVIEEYSKEFLKIRYLIYTMYILGFINLIFVLVLEYIIYMHMVIK